MARTTLPAEVVSAQNLVISDMQTVKAALAQLQADKTANLPTTADLAASQAMPVGGGREKD